MVLKGAREPGDEWHCGQILEVFGGRGMVHVYAFTGGAVLLERLQPAHSLADLSLSGRDEEATRILATVIARLAASRIPPVAVPVHTLADGFRRYLAGGSEQIPTALVRSAHRIYRELCLSQRNIRLLHGDLHQYNVLFDDIRGWVAIDPKGLIGELEYEIGAALRNPYELPQRIAQPRAIESRIAHLAKGLGLDPTRALRWGFAQAVLATIWSVEEGARVDATHPFLQVANAIDSLLGR